MIRMNFYLSDLARIVGRWSLQQLWPPIEVERMNGWMDHRKQASKNLKRSVAAAQPSSVAALGSEKRHRGSEIDDIFASAKSKKKTKEKAQQEQEEELPSKKNTARQTLTSRPVIAKRKDGAIGLLLDEEEEQLQKKRRKRTEEGYPIYTEEELGIDNSRGGDTDLCPFDCKCCY